MIKLRRRARRGDVRHLAVALIIITGCTLVHDAVAEFYVWNDDQGRKHVSNIPARGFAGVGNIRSAYDPNSIVYQHARMLDTLAEQSAAIAHKREAERRRTELERREGQTGVNRHTPREGIMSLDELIALEKRGGRWRSSP